MYLKRIDILGFKSFAEKTTIRFSSGITAIVGPNGCGKTNILDAMRWVLGEQKVSLLRGSKMEEVIFNGTRDIKPLGMSEVTLTIVNDRGVLPTEYHEVQVTRRLFRSGDSEYLLNKIPCRLKDIHELFFDTGAGAHSYSVIEQGMIDAVISDKAEERRQLFEEAAGITKYKQRKRAALRKLEATEQDFLRLNDIYSEIKTRVISLRRQQKKAERYQELVEEVKSWDIYLAARHSSELTRQKRELTAQHDTLSDRLSDRQTQVDKVSAQLEADRKEQIDVERQMTEVGNQAYEASELAHTLEKELSVLTEKRSNARSLIARNQEEIKAMLVRSEMLREQIHSAEVELNRQREDLSGLNTELDAATSAQAEADRRLLNARGAREGDNQRLIELEGKLSSGKTEEEALSRQKTELQDQVGGLKSEIQNHQSRQKEFVDRREVDRRRHDELLSKRTDLTTRRDTLTQEVEASQERIENLTDEISEMAASIEACEARRNLLEDMLIHYEGYQSGVVSTMEVRDRWPSIVGTVAEKIIPNEGMETAVEAALGEISGFIICSDRSSAENIIQFLRNEKRGRVGILLASTGVLNPIVKRPDLDQPGFIGWLDRFVTTDDSLRPLVDTVLARTAVFQAGTDPSPILERLPFGFKAVSTEGVVYTNNHVAGGADESFPLFRRKERIVEQEKLLADLTQQLQTAKRTKDESVTKVAAARAESSRITDELASLAEDVEAASKQIDEDNYELRTIENELTRLNRELKAASTRLESVENRQYELGLDFGQLRDQKKELLSNITSSGEALSDLELAASKATERLSQLQVKMVEARSTVQHSESKISHLNELLTEIGNTVSVKEEEIKTAEVDIATAAERESTLERDLKAAFDSRGTITQRQAAMRQIQTEILERVDIKERELKQFRSDKDSLNQEIHQIELKLGNIESDVTTVGERIKDDYDLDLESVEASKPDPESSDDQGRVLLRERKERLKNFGAVNLLALDEYREASEREVFLGTQLEDLHKAKDDLQTTITKINQTARELFHQTFELARQNFKNLFVELFTGGEADIALVDPNDPLDSDIDITARPRGKRLLSINMMSGGERALTAISLLFALYLVKPSPFCILDEIDAPLDDANCRRFLKIIRNFSVKTQFIIITHNKITMEAADNLYGVTMEQPGVSMLVAVRFRANDDEDEEGRALIDTKAAEEAPTPVDELPDSIRDRITASVAAGGDDEGQAD